MRAGTLTVSPFQTYFARVRLVLVVLFGVFVWLGVVCLCCFFLSAYSTATIVMMSVAQDQNKNGSTCMDGMEKWKRCVIGQG